MFEIKVKIEPQAIADLLSTGIESPVGDWIDKVECGPIPTGLDKPRHWYAEGKLLNHPLFYWTCHYENPVRGAKWLQMMVYKPQLIKGLETMAVKYPRHFADILADNHDAGTADLFLQCIFYGEEIFS